MAGLTDYDLQLEPANSAVKAELTDNLLRDLHVLNVQAANSEFMLTARDSDDQMIGGLIATTSYGWMLIKVLWVKHSERRNGIGAKLMDKATKQARDVGCHGMWLDTSSAPAYAFYTTLGFEVFGTLANDADQHPANHQRWLMRKQIA